MEEKEGAQSVAASHSQEQREIPKWVEEEEKSKRDSAAKVPVFCCMLELPGKLIKISMPSLYLWVC